MGPLPHAMEGPTIEALGADLLWGQALAGFVAFTLVAARLAGMALLAPAFGHPAVPWRVRALVVLGLSMVIAPALHLAPAGGMPRSLVECSRLWLGELAVGAALGLGVLTILSALQAAGVLIDQQLGLSMSELFSPETGASATVSGRLLSQLGLAVLFIVGGHLLLVSALLDSFTGLPLGLGRLDLSLGDLLISLVHESCRLAVRVAAPVLAVMALAGLALGFLERAMRHWQGLAFAIPLRLGLGLLVLGLSLTGAAGLVASAIPETIQSLCDALGDVQ
ncbi:MAG: flagellar biosynthetic protein FliR [Planctomycetaceae bacterium]